MPSRASSDRMRSASQEAARSKASSCASFGTSRTRRLASPTATGHHPMEVYASYPFGEHDGAIAFDDAGNHLVANLVDIAGACGARRARLAWKRVRAEKRRYNRGWKPTPELPGNAHGAQLGVQIEGGLGEKMSGAICSHTARGIPAAVMGCDIPHCPPCQLRRAGELLKAGRNVIGPGTDGGYYLIGLQICQPGLFSGINWGGVDVFRKTMELATVLGIEFTALDTLRDIDDYRDLVAVADKIPILKPWSQ